MALRPDELRAFHDGGYFVRRGLFRADEVDTVRAALERLYATATGRAGDVLFFGPYAVHGSTPNLSSQPRRVLIDGYAAPGANGRYYSGRGARRVLPRP